MKKQKKQKKMETAKKKCEMWKEIEVPEVEQLIENCEMSNLPQVLMLDSSEQTVSELQKHMVIFVKFAPDLGVERMLQKKKQRTK